MELSRQDFSRIVDTLYSSPQFRRWLAAVVGTANPDLLFGMKLIISLQEVGRGNNELLDRSGRAADL